MAIRRAVLLIADIGGYTNYMHWNRAHLAHAQLTVAQLLESVIDAGKGLKLAKLEGDAAFFWAPEGNATVLVPDRLWRMRQSFLARRQRIAADIACDCASCEQLDSLSLKFVAHEGEVAEQKVKRNVELAGVDVILVHRMLKNAVPVPEYVLMTDPVAACLDEATRQLAKPLTHDFDGIGETSTHYLDLATSEAPPTPPTRGLFGRLGMTAKFEMSSLPFLLGIKKPADGFRNLDRGTDELLPS
jgi:ABC-type transporter Mla MlaB component